ncbi:MAG TPA: hypothetical protein ENJ35_03140 [Gammaproteobacteria bacterium]|nr:hypothetical protein [Gammaproteobacteria bacterium]
MATDSSAMAKLAETTKTACATSSDIIRRAKPGTKAMVSGSKIAVLSHTIFLSAIGGIIIGALACHYANKYWSNKKNPPAIS